MYLTLLTLNHQTATARAWAANPYLVHQHLWLAFHHKFTKGRILFRIEETPSSMRVRVLAPEWADWQFAFADLPILKTQPRQLKFVDAPETGEHFHFRLRANVCKGTPLYRQHEQRAWLQEQAKAGGFAVISLAVISSGVQISQKTSLKEPDPISQFAVEFDGVLKVTDPGLFMTTIANGIGRGKGFGFGLLALSKAGLRERRLRTPAPTPAVAESDNVLSHPTSHQRWMQRQAFRLR